MDTQKLCENCQAPLAADAPRGLCPACLMKVAMATATEGPKPGFTPPSIEELARKFPQLELIELIGRGGMGAVYKARQKELDRVVALKILPPGIGEDAAFAERFAREAKALARLNHPGIVTIHDFGQAEGLYFFVMEFVDGVNLRQLLANGRVSAREALAIVPQICDALQYAHDQGIVHRDIKPENLLLDRRGRVKVADFGLAKIIEGRDASPKHPSDEERPAWPAVPASLTDAGKVMGTPAYMAPEQVERPAEVDHRADIYALGVVFYQMLTGELPGKRIEAPSKKVHIDVRLDEVVLRALEQNAELRYQQVSEVKTCVETIVASGNPSATHFSRPADPRPLALTLVSVLFLLLGVYSMWDMAYNTGQYSQRFDPTIFWLPVGMGLLRLRASWRRYALACVWLGYALLLFILSLVFAKANGVVLLPGSTAVEFFGWKPNAVQATWVGVIGFVGQAALLVWLHAVLMRPRVKALFEQQPGKRAGSLELLVVIALVLFAFGWIPSKARTSSAPTQLSASANLLQGTWSSRDNEAFGPVLERVLVDSKASFASEAERTNAPIMIDFTSGSLRAGDDAKMRQASEQAEILGTQIEELLAAAGGPPVSAAKLPKLQFRWVAAKGDTQPPAEVLTDSNGRALRVSPEVVLTSEDMLGASFSKYEPDQKELAASLTPLGGQKFATATATHIGRQLAIVWNGRVVSAPVVRTAITDGRVTISGRFSDAEANRLLYVLNHLTPATIPPQSMPEAGQP